jgi:CHAT domain-containing protein/tetratricopeptide (TPR) repeat protein
MCKKPMTRRKYVLPLLTGVATFLFAVVYSLAQTIPENSAQKIESSQEKLLALRLISAKDQTERGRLLRDATNLVNARLAAEIRNEGDRLEGSVRGPVRLEIYTLALQISESINDRSQIIKSLNDLGIILLAEGKSKDAVASYQRGISISRDTGDKEMTARLLSNLANVYFGNDNEKSTEFTQLSITAAEEIDAQTIIAANLGRLGNLYAVKGDLINAVGSHQRSLKINEHLNNAAGVAINLVNMGIIQTMQGDYSGAQDSFERGLKYFDSVGDKDRAAVTLYNLGNVLLEKGDFARAMSCYSRSLQIFEQLGSLGGIEGVATNVANLYIVQGNYELARSYLDRASLVADKTGKTIPQYALGSFGDSYKGEGRFDKAIEYYERLLAIKESSENKDSLAETLINIGNCYLLVPNPEKARQYFERAMQMTDKTGSYRWSLRALIGLAEYHLAQNDFRLAFEYATRAKAQYEKLNGSKEYEELFTALGRAKLGLGDKEQARLNFEKAIAIIEDQRGRVAGNSSERQGFFRDKTLSYNLITETLVSGGAISEAFKYSEMGKARTLIEAISGGGKINISVSLTPEERVKERSLRNELVSFHSQIEKENTKEKPDIESLETLKVQLAKKRLESEDFQVQLYSLHPELRFQRGEIKPISAQEAAYLLKDDKSAIVEFSVAREKTFLFVISKDVFKKVTLKAYKIDIKGEDLSRTVEAYRSKIAAGDLGFANQSREMYDLLLQPAAAQLSGKTNLIIVPDGALWDLPFQTLQSSRNKYLLENAAISYAPSLTALRVMTKKSKKKNADANLELLAFGNPEIRKETAESVTRVFMGEKLEPLPEAERLVNSLKKMYGPNRAEVFTRSDAREETAKIEAPKFRIVQFAAHGILNNASPMYSHVVLSQNANNPNEDGLLEAWEMRDLGLKADMVILSACDTARGRISNGEGVIGMTWALFIAGTPTTVATQWKVESSSTTELMLEFHRQLLSAKRTTKAEALRVASLKLLRSGKYSHPAYWAGFVMVGDGS